MVAGELGRLLSPRRPQHALPEGDRLAWVVSRSRHVDEPDVVSLGFLCATERKRGGLAADAEQRPDPNELTGRDRHAARDDGGGHLGQVFPLDSLGHVLGCRMGDFVAQHGCESRIVSSERQDARVHDDLAARQTVGICLVLAKQSHLPDKGRFVTAGHGLDPLGDPLYFRVAGPGLDDSRPVLPERLRILLAPQLHLLCVCKPDALLTMGDRRLLAVGLCQQQDSHHRCRDEERNQRPRNNEADQSFPESAHQWGRVCGGTTRRGRDECCMRSCETLPTTNSRTPVRPWEPITIARARVSSATSRIPSHVEAATEPREVAENPAARAMSAPSAARSEASLTWTCSKSTALAAEAATA